MQSLLKATKGMGHRRLTGPAVPTRASWEACALQVCQILSSRLHHIHLNATVEAVYNENDQVMVQCAGKDTIAFDHVIFASQANQALRMLRDPSTAEVPRRMWRAPKDATVQFTEPSLCCLELDCHGGRQRRSAVFITCPPRSSCTWTAASCPVRAVLATWPCPIAVAAD